MSLWRPQDRLTVQVMFEEHCMRATELICSSEQLREVKL